MRSPHLLGVGVEGPDEVGGTEAAPLQLQALAERQGVQHVDVVTRRQDVAQAAVVHHLGARHVRVVAQPRRNCDDGDGVTNRKIYKRR